MTLIQKLIALMKPQTTAEIMATFTSKIEELRIAAAAHSRIAIKQRDKAQAAIAKAEVAEAEVRAAGNAAAKLEGFLA